MSGRSLLPPLGLIGQVGFVTLLAVVALAPALGGYPTGAEYGADTALNALRAMTALAALCLALAPPLRAAPTPDRIASAARLAVWAAFALALLSLLVHSRFLTSPVLLFAMLPATLDWLTYALALTLAAYLARDRGAGTLLVGALVVGAGWAALRSVQEYGQFAQGGMRGQRAQGVFFSPNFAAGFFGLTLPVAAAWCVAARHRLAALALGAVGALMAGALVATGSRAGIALAAGGLVVAFALAIVTTRGRLLWVRVAALAVAVLALGFAFRGPITTRVSEGGTQEYSGQFRSWTWKGTVAMAKAQPVLGAGPGTFPYLYPRYSLVARTDLAHSSYLQLAAEEGFPALAAAVAAIVLALGAGALRLLKSRPVESEGEDGGTSRLLLCGLIGGLVVGAARSVFDSEWSLLGNGIPFWTVAGLCARFSLEVANAPEAVKSGAATSPLRLLSAAGLVVALAFSLVLLRNVSPRDAAQAALRNRQQASPPPVGWPPDPTTLFLNSEVATAAEIEPSGKRLYQLGRFYERNGDLPQAIDAMKRSTEADPTKMQTWRRLAELQEQAGQKADALRSWSEIVRLQEGPVGKYRAIPELPETYPALAYAALADAARGDGKADEAANLYEKAAAVVEQYSETKPLYQQMELVTARTNGIDVTQRRAEVRDLYTRVMRALEELRPAQAAEVRARRDAALARLDAFAKPESVAGGAGG